MHLSTDAIRHHIEYNAWATRGQVSGFLRTLGKVPPPLDFIRFVRENADSASVRGVIKG